jgi:uncharacterized protein YfaS (alpha-2-macroglobulin family)
MVAHFKHGAQSSLVWVTSLDKGKPVAKAQVAVRDYDGKLLWQGMTDADGLAHIRRAGQFQLQEQWPLLHQCAQRRRHDVHPVRLGGRHRAWRFNLPTDDTRADNTLRRRYSTARCCAPAKRT